MRKIILIISLFLFCNSCFINKGLWIGDVCRPKKTKFSILKIPFKETNKLSFQKIYLTRRKFRGIGFYPDGRLIYLVAKGNNCLRDQDVIAKNWDNAKYIGYWRVEKENIKIEYFLCGNSGNYIKKKGLIKGDTIFFEYNYSVHPFKSKKAFHPWVLSNMSFD